MHGNRGAAARDDDIEVAVAKASSRTGLLILLI
jgi:hypothetical protein